MDRDSASVLAVFLCTSYESVAVLWATNCTYVPEELSDNARSIYASARRRLSSVILKFIRARETLFPGHVTRDAHVNNVLNALCHEGNLEELASIMQKRFAGGLRVKYLPMLLNSVSGNNLKLFWFLLNVCAPVREYWTDDILDRILRNSNTVFLAEFFKLVPKHCALTRSERTLHKLGKHAAINGCFEILEMVRDYPKAWGSAGVWWCRNGKLDCVERVLDYFSEPDYSEYGWFGGMFYAACNKGRAAVARLVYERSSAESRGRVSNIYRPNIFCAAWRGNSASLWQFLFETQDFRPSENEAMESIFVIGNSVRKNASFRFLVQEMNLYERVLQNENDILKDIFSCQKVLAKFLLRKKPVEAEKAFRDLLSRGIGVNANVLGW